jgi:hypothetical protein
MPTLVNAAVFVVGIVTGAIVPVFVRWLEYPLGWRSARLQRLVNLYSELIAAAASDLERAQSLQSALDFRPPESDPGYQRFTDHYVALEKERHSNRRELTRLAFQLGLYETNESLRSAVDDLRVAQPVFYAIGVAGNFERFAREDGKHREAIEAYVLKIGALRDGVRQQYAVFRPRL